MIQDQVSGAPVFIDEVHHKIHAGAHWVASHTVSVGTATAVTVMLTTGATSDGIVHVVFDIEASNAITGTFNEAPGASGGTVITPRNSSRDTAGSSGVASVTHTVTYATGGTVLENYAIGGANARVRGGAGARIEWVLGASKAYLWRFVAANAGTTVDVNIYWYEEK